MTSEDRLKMHVKTMSIQDYAALAMLLAQLRYELRLSGGDQKLRMRSLYVLNGVLDEIRYYGDGPTEPQKEDV